MSTKGHIRKSIAASLIAMLFCCHSQSILAKDNIIVIVDVPEKLDTITRQALNTGFVQIDFKIFTTNDLPTAKSEDQVIVGLGFNGCKIAITRFNKNPVLCSLLSTNAFQNINNSVNTTRSIAAIVVDQPLQRQINVAQHLFPSLKDFALLTSNLDSLREPQSPSVKATRFNRNRPIARQVRTALKDADALLAIPDPLVYSNTTLRTMLLTTYGYAKPVIGYSRSYVEAGALMTNWSSPEQLIRQTSEILLSGFPDTLDGIITPKYFSIKVNAGISRSLNLAPQKQIDAATTYVDEDFQS